MGEIYQIKRTSREQKDPLEGKMAKKLTPVDSARPTHLHEQQILLVAKSIGHPSQISPRGSLDPPVQNPTPNPRGQSLGIAHKQPIQLPEPHRCPLTDLHEPRMTVHMLEQKTL